jgi:ribosome-associated heat shock protein Hsp15
MTGERDPDPTIAAETQRVDKWLWFARVAKTRTQAAALVSEGKVRINREKTDRPSQLVRRGDVLTIAVHGRVRVLEVLAAGERRGSSSDAQAIAKDLTPTRVSAPAPAELPQAVREAGSGRPTKRERRQRDQWLDEDRD